jgi:superfamily I DNA/RNA helicase
MNIDPQQKAAVETDSRRALVLAGAGSGKTHTLVERIAYLIENQKVSPYEIMAFTFTRKAAGELKSRLVERIGSQAYHVATGTIHALALQMIHRFGELIGLRQTNVTVYGQWEEDFLLRDVAADMGILKGKTWKIPKGEIDQVFANYYQKGIEPDMGTNRVWALFHAFIQRCKENNSLTYGGLLTGMRLLIDSMAKYLHIRHILVDEVQDIDPLQWELILTMEIMFAASLYVVGDIDQCQPAGTMVKVISKPKIGRNPTEYEWVDISVLKDGDEVLSWSKNDQRVYHVGRTIKVSKRLYDGQMLKIYSNNNATRMTPNHWVWARFNKKSLGQRVVYLMHRVDRGYRVGTSKLRTPHGAVSLNVRCRLEKSDRIWILRICDSKREAEMWEQIIAIRYQIPYCTFETNGSRSKEEIQQIFRETADVSKGYQCLQAHGLLFDYPILRYPSEKLQKLHGYFKIAVANLIPEIMDLPTTLTNGSSPISAIEREDYRGFVYSLDVEHDHTYIADGIPVGNSIYEWRGAAPKYLVDHQGEFDVYRLETNYRSVPAIVEASNRLIANNQDRIGKTMKAVREDTGRDAVGVMIQMDSERMLNVAPFVTCPLVILSRIHGLLEKIDRLMIEKGIPHVYIGKEAALTNSEDFRRFHAFLKLACNPYDNFSFLLAREVLKLTRELYSDIRLKAAQDGTSHFQAWMEDGAIEDITDHKEWFRNIAENQTLLETLTSGFLPLINDAATFAFRWVVDRPSGTVAEYLDWLATYDIQDEIKAEDQEGITLMTIHAAKGLEWPVVIVAGCNEGFIPSKHAINNDDIEAERRLFYVAMTRAKDQLILTVRPETEEKHGHTFESPISRFIREAL